MPAAVEWTGTGQAAPGDAGHGGVVVQERARADGTALLEREVRELVRRRGVDPIAEPERFAELVQEAAADYADRVARGVLFELPDMERAVRQISDAVGGLGVLQPYLDDPEIEEIWINAPSRAADLLSRQGVVMGRSLLSEGLGGGFSASLIAATRSVEKRGRSSANFLMRASNASRALPGHAAVGVIPPPRIRTSSWCPRSRGRPTSRSGHQARRA